MSKVLNFEFHENEQSFYIKTKNIPGSTKSSLLEFKIKLAKYSGHNL